MINLVYSYKANQHDSNVAYHFSDPTNVGCCFAISLRRFCQNQHYLDERSWTVLKQPEANTDLLYFSALSYYKSSVKQISLYLLSQFRIRIIVLTCPDDKSARNHQPKSCVPAKSHKITMMRGQYYFNWNLRSLSVCSCSCEDSRVLPLNLYYDISIAEDLHCLKAVDRNFVRNGGTTRTHSSLCSWAGVSEQIANNVLFWLRLSKI